MGPNPWLWVQWPTLLGRGDWPGQYRRVCCQFVGLSGLPAAAWSPVTVEFAGRGTDLAPGAGSLLAGFIKCPELARSLVFRLPARCWEVLVPLPDMVLRFPGGTAGFFIRAIASLTSLRRAGETCKVEMAFIKANSS